MAGIRKRERLLNLVSFLLKSRRPVGLEEIRTSVMGYEPAGRTPPTVERLFERDKATLRELGVPLKFLGENEPGGPGYVIPRNVYFLPNIQLSSSEAAILATASRFALTGAAGPVSDALKAALRKLQFDSPIPGRIRQTAEEHFLFHRREATADAGEQAKLRELTAAVLARRAVRFTYYAIGQDRVARRVMEPYGIGFADGHWYLVGRDRGRKAIRVFRVDRIRDAVKRVHPDAARAEFEVPRDFAVKDHIGVPPWLFGQTRRTAVCMKFDPEIAFMVRLRPVPGDKWQRHKDGSVTLTRYATNLDALLNWVLGFGRHVEVLDPPEFRSRVIGTLRAIASAHGKHANVEAGHG